METTSGDFLGLGDVAPPCSPPVSLDDHTRICDWLSSTNSTCSDWDSERELFRQEMLQAAQDSREMWASTSFALSLAACIVDAILLLLVLTPAMRRQRAIQAAGVGHLVILLLGCIVGHMSTLFDGFTWASESGVWCRGRLLFIYVFIR